MSFGDWQFVETWVSQQSTCWARLWLNEDTEGGGRRKREVTRDDEDRDRDKNVFLYEPSCIKITSVEWPRSLMSFVICCFNELTMSWYLLVPFIRLIELSLLFKLETYQFVFVTDFYRKFSWQNKDYNKLPLQKNHRLCNVTFYTIVIFWAPNVLAILDILHCFRLGKHNFGVILLSTSISYTEFVYIRTLFVYENKHILSHENL